MTLNRSLTFGVSALAVVAASSCSHTQEELTAPEHRAAAAEHRAAALEERERYDPSQEKRAPLPPRTPFNDQVMLDPDATTYNPTEEHLHRADAQMKEAAAHLKAARKIESFEHQACKAIAPAQRASCPLLASQVALVNQLPNGLALVLKPGANGEDINQRLNCHLAYANANGFDRPSCPLFVKGMDIRLKGDSVLELTAEQPEAVQAMKRQARRIFVGEQPTISRSSP